jgi:hypothetical protein
MSLEKRQLIQAEVEEMRQKTGIGIIVLAGWAGVPRSTWQGGQGEKTKHNGNLPKYHWLTPVEQEAILAYCRERLGQGYRQLTYQMMDENIAAVSRFPAPRMVFGIQPFKYPAKRVLARYPMRKHGNRLNHSSRLIKKAD